MTLRLNEDGEWMMPRGLSQQDMAHEITEALGWQEGHPPPERVPADLTIAREYVKVTGKRGILPCRVSRLPTSG